MTRSVLGDVNSLIDHGISKGDETDVCGVISFLIYAGKFHLAAGLPPILRAEKEMRLNRGIADYVLFHNDGSITVLEAKKHKGRWTKEASAIGQVMFYACQLSLSMPGKHIRAAIVSDMNGGDMESGLVCQTARKAGVTVVPLGDLSVLDEILTRAGVYE